MSISIAADAISATCKQLFTLLVYGRCGLYLGSVDATRRCTLIYQCQSNCDPVYIESIPKMLISICYDPQRDCYWAAESGSASIVYRLDQAFAIAKTLQLNLPYGFHDTIKSIGISYECSEIIIAYTWYIYRFSLEGEYIASDEVPCGNMDYIACLPVSPYIGKIFYRPQQYFFALCLADQIICEEKLPDDVIPLSLTYCDLDNHESMEFYILGKGNKMLQITVPPECLSEPTCGCGCTDSPSECVCVIDSIAAVENSVAALLHAEATKLQKIIHCSDDVEEMLQANESVSKVLQQVIMLEQLLVMKLTACDAGCEGIDSRVDQLCKQCGNGDSY